MLKFVTVLVVEDDEDIQQIILHHLKKKNYKVLMYDQVPPALDDLVNKKVTCDLILTDLKLPKISGIEFIKHVRKFDKSIPIILMTTNNKVEVAAEAITSGASDYMVKPVYFPQLFNSIERHIYLRKQKEKSSRASFLPEEFSCG